MLLEKDSQWLDPNILCAFAQDALRSRGADGSVAKSTAKGLMHASLRGVDSHGIRLLPHYCRGLEHGRINPRPSWTYSQLSDSSGLLDADHTFGHAAGVVAIDHAISIAGKTGCGFVAVKNSSHCGAMSFFALEACRHDMIGLAFTHATSKMRSANGVRPFFGTNPICFTAPMLNEEPFCFDSAPTPITANRVNQHREAGMALPERCAADQHGVETTDPMQAVQLLPIGDYKGFGWSIVVDILCGLMSGMPVGRSISKMFEDPMDRHRCLGQFYGAIRIDAFLDPKVFKARLQALADDVRNELPMKPDQPVQFPGDPEKRTRSERIEKGIPLSERQLAEFDRLAEELDLPPLPRGKRKSQ